MIHLYTGILFSTHGSTILIIINNHQVGTPFGAGQLEVLFYPHGLALSRSSILVVVPALSSPGKDNKETCLLVVPGFEPTNFLQLGRQSHQLNHWCAHQKTFVLEHLIIIHAVVVTSLSETTYDCTLSVVVVCHRISALKRLR